MHFYLISNLEPDCKKVQMRYELHYGSCHKKLVIEYKGEPLSCSIKHWVFFASYYYHLVTNYILDYHERIPPYLHHMACHKAFDMYKYLSINHC